MTEEEWKDICQEAAFAKSELEENLHLTMRIECKTFLALFSELKERREDEEWLKKQTCYVFCYTHISGCGFQIGSKCPDRMWGLGSTLHEAVEKARGYKEGGR